MSILEASVGVYYEGIQNNSQGPNVLLIKMTTKNNNNKILAVISVDTGKNGKHSLIHIKFIVHHDILSNLTDQLH